MIRRPALAMAAALSCFSSLARAESWELWTVKPADPGRIDTCEMLKTAADPLAGVAVKIAQEVAIRWRGGELLQPGLRDLLGEGERDTWSVYTSCFVLRVGDRIVAAGAMVPKQSARLLRFDTLVLRSEAETRPLAFDLLPHFPAEIAAPVPESWTRALTPLSVPSDRR